MKLLLLIVVIGLATVLAEEKEDDVGHGFGNLNWVKWENARELAKMQRKPVLLLIHKSWCGACKALKLKFQQKTAEQQMKTLSKHFVMVNTEDDEEPWEDEFRPDGKYIPRIIFVDPEGEVMDVQNEKAEYENYKYYYTSPAQVMQSMRKVIKLLDLAPVEESKEKKEEAKPPADEAPAPPADDAPAKAPSTEPKKSEL